MKHQSLPLFISTLFLSLSPVYGMNSSPHVSDDDSDGSENNDILNSQSQNNNLYGNNTLVELLYVSPGKRFFGLGKQKEPVFTPLLAESKLGAAQAANALSKKGGYGDPSGGYVIYDGFSHQGKSVELSEGYEKYKIDKKSDKESLEALLGNEHSDLLLSQKSISQKKLKCKGKLEEMAVLFLNQQGNVAVMPWLEYKGETPKEYVATKIKDEKDKNKVVATLYYPLLFNTANKANFLSLHKNEIAKDGHYAVVYDKGTYNWKLEAIGEDWKSKVEITDEAAHNKMKSRFGTLSVSTLPTDKGAPESSSAGSKMAGIGGVVALYYLLKDKLTPSKKKSTSTRKKEKEQLKLTQNKKEGIA